MPPRSTPMTQLGLARAVGMGAATIPTPNGRRAAAEYKVYRSRPRAPAARASPRATASPSCARPPPRRSRSASPSGRTTRSTGPAGAARGCPRCRKREPRVPGAPRRAHQRVARSRKWLALALFAWVAVSAVLFMVSRPDPARRPRERGRRQLDPGPYPLTGANTILVLGSDARTEGLAEPGAAAAPAASDSIMLMRIGGGSNASLSIPRDTRRRHPRPRHEQDQRRVRVRRRRARDADGQGVPRRSRSTTSSR